MRRLIFNRLDALAFATLGAAVFAGFTGHARLTGILSAVGWAAVAWSWWPSFRAASRAFRDGDR